MRLTHTYPVCATNSPPRFKAALNSAWETYQRTRPPVLMIFDREYLRLEGQSFWVEIDALGGLRYGLLSEVGRPVKERFEIPDDGRWVPIILEAR